MYLLEQLMAAIVFSFRLERREQAMVRTAACLTILGGLTLVMELGFLSIIYSNPWQASSWKQITIFLSSILFSLQIVAILTGAILFVCRVSLTEALYAETCAYLTEHIAFCVRVLVNAGTGTAYADSPAHWSYWLIHVAVYAGAYYLFARNMIRRGHYFAAPGRTIRLLLYALGVILVLSTLSSIYDRQTIHAVYGIAFAVYALFSQIDRQAQLAAQEEIAVRGQLQIAQRQQYVQFQRNVSFVNRKCHDLRHQAGKLLRNVSGEAQREEIKSFIRSIMIYDSFVRTGSRELDTILNQKNAVCLREKITLTCVADGKALHFMNPVDLFTVFDSVFDRIIGEVRKLPEDLRRIHLTVAEKMQVVVISLEYPAESAAAVTRNGGTQTEHTQFLRNLELALEPYGGTVQQKNYTTDAVLRIVLQEPEEI